MVSERYDDPGMSSITDGIRRLRLPEYTGENRCIPCTIVNLGIALVVGGAVAVVSRPAAVVVFALCVAAIYLRGYLVPGTPTLTKHYFPDSVLKLFDKHDPPAPAVTDQEDIERFLLEVDAVEECREGTDLCLTPGFREAWHDRIAARREASDPDADVDEGIAALFEGVDVDLDRVSVQEYGDAYDAYVDDLRVGQWESRGAFLADVAAEAELRARHPAWERIGFDARMEILGALRLWLDRCPTCEGPVTLDEETVESCCRSIDVVAATCDDCGARLFEAQFSPDALAAE